jgi:hypothetical protein
MHDKPFQPSLLRIYCSRTNLALFIAGLQIDCASAIPDGYHDSDVFNISPDYIPLFLKPVLQKDLQAFGQSDIIAMDLSPAFMSGFQSRGFYVLTTELKLEWKKKEHISYSDMLVFIPGFVPLSFVENICTPDDGILSAIRLDLADELRFLKSLANRLKRARVFADSGSASYDLLSIESPPAVEDAAGAVRKAGAVRALLYCLQDIKNSETIQAALYYALACNRASKSLPSMLADILSVRETGVEKTLAIHVLEGIFQYLLENLRVDRRIIQVIIDRVCGTHVVDSRTVCRMDQKIFELLKKIGKLEDLLAGDILSSDYFDINEHPEMFQGVACLNRFESHEDYYASKEEIKRFVKKAGAGFFYFYICYLAVQKGLKGLRINDTVFKDKGRFFDWLICRYLSSLNDLYYRFEDRDMERIFLENLIKLQYPDCHETLLTIINRPGSIADEKLLETCATSYQKNQMELREKQSAISEKLHVEGTVVSGEEATLAGNILPESVEEADPLKRESSHESLPVVAGTMPLFSNNTSEG